MVNTGWAKPRSATAVSHSAGDALGVELRHVDAGRTGLDEQTDRQSRAGGSVDDVAADRQTRVCEELLDGDGRGLRAALAVPEGGGEEIRHVSVGDITAPGHDDEGAQVRYAERARLA